MAKKRSIGSLKAELLKKSQEAALAAIKVFNDPLVQFKSETYIVLMVIAWTYLLHAYYRGKGIDYRYFGPAPIPWTVFDLGNTPFLPSGGGRGPSRRQAQRPRCGARTCRPAAVGRNTADVHAAGRRRSKLTGDR